MCWELNVTNYSAFIQSTEWKSDPKTENVILTTFPKKRRTFCARRVKCFSLFHLPKSLLSHGPSSLGSAMLLCVYMWLQLLSISININRLWSEMVKIMHIQIHSRFKWCCFHSRYVPTMSFVAVFARAHTHNPTVKLRRRNPRFTDSSALYTLFLILSHVVVDQKVSFTHLTLLCVLYSWLDADVSTRI